MIRLVLGAELAERATLGLADVHDVVARAPGVPAWYGRNLDALFDVLTRTERAEVEIEAGFALRASLGADFDRLWSTLTDAAAANPGVSLVWRASPRGGAGVR